MRRNRRDRAAVVAGQYVGNRTPSRRVEDRPQTEDTAQLPRPAEHVLTPDEMRRLELAVRAGQPTVMPTSIAGWTGTLRTPQALGVAAAQREADAMVRIAAALAPLTTAERDRVLAWAYAHRDEHRPESLDDLRPGAPVGDPATTPEGSNHGHAE